MISVPLPVSLFPKWPHPSVAEVRLCRVPPRACAHHTVQGRGAFRSQFLDNASWAQVRAHADAAARAGATNANGTDDQITTQPASVSEVHNHTATSPTEHNLTATSTAHAMPSAPPPHSKPSHGGAASDGTVAVGGLGRELVNCQTPRMKRLDFCFWSAPATPLLDVLQELREELSGDAAREERCRAYLNGTAFRTVSGGRVTLTAADIYSEHVLLCAMHAARVAQSKLRTLGGLANASQAPPRTPPCVPLRTATPGLLSCGCGDTTGCLSVGDKGALPTPPTGMIKAGSGPPAAPPSGTSPSRSSPSPLPPPPPRAHVRGRRRKSGPAMTPRSLPLGATTSYAYLPAAARRPSAPFSASPPSKAAAIDTPTTNTATDTATDALMLALDRLQNPSDDMCNQSARLAHYWNGGFAATFHYLVLTLKRALRDGRGAVVFARGAFPANNRWQPADRRQFYYGACASGGLECVLAPSSSCGAVHAVRQSVQRLQQSLPPRLAGDTAFVDPAGWRLYYPSRVVDNAPEWLPSALSSGSVSPPLPATTLASATENAFSAAPVAVTNALPAATSTATNHASTAATATNAAASSSSSNTSNPAALTNASWQHHAIAATSKSLAVTATPPPLVPSSTFWLIAGLSGFLFRLSDAVQSAVARVRVVRLGEPYVGVHVRRGDACDSQRTLSGSRKPLADANYSALRPMRGTRYPAFVRTCTPTAVYAAHAARLARELSVPTIFLATDDVEVREEMWEALQAVDSRLILRSRVAPRVGPLATQKVAVRSSSAGATAGATAETQPAGLINAASAATSSRRPRPARVERELQGMRRDSVALEHATIGVVTDIDALADASALVGAFSSQLFRLAFELSYFRKRAIVPFESVDIGWCWGGYAPVTVTDREGRRWSYAC